MLNSAGAVYKAIHGKCAEKQQIILPLQSAVVLCYSDQNDMVMWSADFTLTMHIDMILNNLPTPNSSQDTAKVTMPQHTL